MRELRREDFDGNAALETGVAGMKDLSHPAGLDAGDDFVAAQLPCFHGVQLRASDEAANRMRLAACFYGPENGTPHRVTRLSRIQLEFWIDCQSARKVSAALPFALRCAMDEGEVLVCGYFSRVAKP